MQPDTATRSDIATLQDLNHEYIAAVVASDVEWFRRRLAGDFRCSLPDGSIIAREDFLRRAAGPIDISCLEVHDVEIRLFGDAAIVHACTTFRTQDGKPGTGRYTDVWYRNAGEWRAVAAHVTRQVG